MVAIGISEFTFGFAFLYELTTANWGGLTAAPILPSLQQEQNEGWDAKLPLQGAPFYYQFKLAEYLSRSNATYIDDGTYAGPYFRISLHRRENNRQHRLLWALGQQNPETYYVAPEVLTRNQFNDAFLNRSMVPNSRMIRLADCEQLDETDGEAHVITFRQNEQGLIFHSDPKRAEGTYRGKDILTLFESTRQSWRTVDNTFVKDLLDQTIETVRRIEGIENERAIVTQRHLIDEPVTGLPRTLVLQRVADIAATVFGVTMVMVGSRPNP
jgi:hypothetical protein